MFTSSSQAKVVCHVFFFIHDTVIKHGHFFSMHDIFSLIDNYLLIAGRVPTY